MADLIDRQAAIDACRHAWAKGLEPSQYIETIPAAEPYVSDMNVGDMISRQDAIDALSNLMDTDGFRDGWAVSRSNVECMLRALPAAQPDLSAYSDKLWRKAYERGKAEGQEELPQIVRCKDCKHCEKDTDNSCFCGALWATLR